MQELEKILEEMREASVFAKNYDGSVAECVTIGAAERILRKHTKNDGWIPVDKKLPNGGYECEVTLDSGIRSIGWYNKIDYIWFNTKGDIIDVIAWKEPSEPYRPGRSEMP